MTIELPYWLAFVVTWFVVTWVVFRMFKEAGDTVNSNTKESASHWLRNISVKPDDLNWPSHFASLFDRVFTKKHWSTKCFFRSFLASLVSAVFLIFLVYITSQIYIAKKITEVNRTKAYKENPINFKDITQKDDLLPNTFFTEEVLEKRRVDALKKQKEYIEKHDTITSFIIDIDNPFTLFQVKYIENYRESTSQFSQTTYSLTLDSLKEFVGSYNYGREIENVSVDSVKKIWKQYWNDPKLRDSLQMVYDSINLAREVANNELDERKDQIDSIPKNYSVVSTALFLLMSLIINPIVDYFSLLETRYFIKRMEKTNRISLWSSFLVVDFIITGIIFFIVVFIMYLFFDKLSLNNFYLLIIDTYRDVFNLSFTNNGLVIPLLTTYITSIWLWIYVGSGFFMKFINTSDTGIQFLKSKLDIEGKPFRSIGAFAVGLITIAYIIWGILIVVS